MKKRKIENLNTTVVETAPMPTCDLLGCANRCLYDFCACSGNMCHECVIANIKLCGKEPVYQCPFCRQSLAEPNWVYHSAKAQRKIEIIKATIYR